MLPGDLDSLSVLFRFTQLYFCLLEMLDTFVCDTFFFIEREFVSELNNSYNFFPFILTVKKLLNFFAIFVTLVFVATTEKMENSQFD